MLKTLRDLFLPDDGSSPEESTRSVNAAVAILLMEVARADFDVADEELAIILDILLALKDEDSYGAQPGTGPE